MDYTQHGVLEVQRRVAERLRSLAVEKHIPLDPGSPRWFDGHMTLPIPGRSWKLTFSSHGAFTSTEFTPQELDDFMAAKRYEVVSKGLARTLDSLLGRR
jgi:hypothetical protein